MLSDSGLLDERKQIILRAIVHDYTSAAEPVSSEMLAYRYRLGVKPATIRNEMAEMSEMGYLRQPHTSAGRVPTDLGYRFYVDKLISGPGLSSAEEGCVAESYGSAPAETESLLGLTCRLLSELTHYASVATEPNSSDTTIQFVSLSLLDPGKLLLVLVTSDGRVQHSILELPSPTSQHETLTLSNILSDQFRGSRLESVLSHNMDFTPPEAAGMQEQYCATAKALKHLVREIRNADVRVNGTGHILSQPEFKDIKRFETLMTAFERRRVLFETLNAAISGSDTTIIIGNENPYVEMRECSFVTATYRIGNRKCGAIGVIGPTRMNYRRAIAAVNLLAQNLSELLTAISIG